MMIHVMVNDGDTHIIPYEHQEPKNIQWIPKMIPYDSFILGTHQEIHIYTHIIHWPFQEPKYGT